MMTSLPDIEKNEDSTRVTDQIMDLKPSRLILLRIEKELVLPPIFIKFSYSLNLDIRRLIAANIKIITLIQSPLKIIFVKLT